MASQVSPAFRSGLERQFAKQFPTLAYETTRLKYTVVHTYTPDFKINDNTYIEVKGLFVSADRAKHLFIKKQHPEITVIFVFQEPKRRLSKLSKTTYADWCDSHGYRWYDAKCVPNDIMNTFNTKEVHK